MLGRPRKHPLVLTDDERKALEAISNSRNKPPRLVQGARIILASLNGHTNREVAASVHMSESYVAQFLRRVPLLGPMAALEELPQTSHPLRISPEARAWICALAHSSPREISGAGQDSWSMDSLARYAREHCEDEGYPQLKAVAKSTVWHILMENRRERRARPHRAPTSARA